MQFCVLSNITRNIRVMRTPNFERGFCSHRFRHVMSEKSFSIHSPTAKFSLSCLIQHRCLHHGSRALLVAAAPQSQHREEKSGEVSWRRVRCLAFVTHSPTVSLRFSIALSPRRQRCRIVEAALLQEMLRTNGSAGRHGKKLVFFCVRNTTVSQCFVFFWTLFPRQSPWRWEMLDIDARCFEN